MANSGSSPTLTNCSFQGNLATQGGGISNNSFSPTLTNCVLFGNGDGNTFFNTGGASTTATYSLFDNTVTGYTSAPGNLTTTSPFVSTNSVALVACSPAINAGDPATTSATVGTTDLVGNPRFFSNGRIDMGAVEFQGAGLSGPTWTGCTSTDWNTAGNWASGFVPTATDNVVIPSGRPNQPILSTTAVAFSVEVQSGASFTITNTGSLSINGFKSIGLSTTAFYNNGTVTSEGQLIIGNTAEVGQSGLSNEGAFINQAQGRIQIDRSTFAGLYTPFGSFVNSASITIGATAPVGATAVLNGASFNNSGCSALLNVVANAVITNFASFTNTGTLIENASGNSNISFNGSVVQNLNGGTFTIGGGTGPLSRVLSSTAAPTASLSAVSLSFCTGTSLTLTASGGTSYTFSNGATQLGGSSGNTATVSAGGTYSVVVSAATGCTNTASISVTATPTISAITPASLMICEEQPLGLTATITPGTAYSLTFSLFNGLTRVASQSATANQNIATISIPQTGTLTPATVIAVATGAGGCSTTFVGPVIAITPILFAGPPTLNSSMYSPGQTAIVSYSAGQCSFKNNGLYTVDLLSAAINYTLAQSLTVVAANATSLSVVIPANLAPGTYKVQVVYGDPVYSPVSVTFVVNSLTLTITASTTLICVGQPVSLTASGCGTGATYQWSTGQSGPVITYTPRSTSLVTVTCVTTGGPRVGAPGAVESDAATGPGDEQGSEAIGDKPRPPGLRPARDPRDSRQQ